VQRGSSCKLAHANKETFKWKTTPFLLSRRYLALASFNNKEFSEGKHGRGRGISALTRPSDQRCGKTCRS
jgi:hypothetical protein